MTESRSEFERRLAERFEAYVEEGVGTMDPKTVARAVARKSQVTGRLRMATLASATVALAAIATVSVAQLFPTKPAPLAPSSGSPSQTTGASGNPQASPLTLTWPTVAPWESAVPTQPDLAHIGFWTLEQPMAAADLSVNTLRVGTLDGRVTRTVALHNPGMGPLDVPLQPMPVGPANGRVLYVSADGREAVLHVVRTGSGTDSVLLTSTGIFASLAIDPSGETAYYLNLDPETGRVGGVDAIATDGGEPQIVIRDVDVSSTAAAPFALVAQVSYRPQLAVSMDGSWVVLASCGPSSCELVAAQPARGLLEHWRSFRFDDTIIGIVGDLLIGSATCQEAVCDGFALDLRTGERWPLGGTQGTFDPKQVIAGPHGPLALGQGGDYEKGNWQVEALDLTSRTRHIVFTATFKPGYTVVQLAEEHGAELPPGWFLIYRNTDAAPAPYPDFSAATLGRSTEAPLDIMTFPRR